VLDKKTENRGMLPLFAYFKLFKIYTFFIVKRVIAAVIVSIRPAYIKNPKMFINTGLDFLIPTLYINHGGPAEFLYIKDHRLSS
jgi:hypothetical protein